MQSRISATAGILTALATAGAGITGMFYGKQYVESTCKQSSEMLNSLITSFLDRTFTFKQFNINIITPFPSEVPISTSVFIEKLNQSIPINTTVNLDLPDSLNISIGPISDSVASFLTEVIGQDGMNFLRSLSAQAEEACETYSAYALLGIGALTLAALLWQIGITFGFGSKFCAQDHEIKKLQKELKQIREKLLPHDVSDEHRISFKS